MLSTAGSLPSAVISGLSGASDTLERTRKGQKLFLGSFPCPTVPRTAVSVMYILKSHKHPVLGARISGH